MSEAVMISIQPKWCKLIANGKKTIEVRKTKPKLETPFKVYIYETKAYDTLFGKGKPKKLCVGGGRVIGEFVCDSIDEYTNYSLDEQKGHIKRREDLLRSACMTLKDWQDYIGSYRSDKGYAWHISNLVIYDKPKELSEFCKGFDDSFDIMYGSYCKYCDKRNKLTRPFQSWGYVEEQE